MGFFPHTGGSYTHFTPLAMPTFATILDSIVSDVGAGVGNWTLFDDQRSASTYWIPINIGGAQLIGGSYGTTWAASTSLTGTGTRYLRSFIPNTSVVSNDGGTNSRTVTAITNDTSATINSNWTGSASNSKVGVEQAFGYIVLKYTSTQKTFYVQLVRPKSYGDLLRVRTWETWDSGTHLGTNQLGPEEVLRAYGPASQAAQKTSTVTVQYILFLLPDTFAIWAGADPSQTGTTNFWDFYYCGNLVPLRGSGDNGSAFIQACSNQELSGFYTSNPSINAAGSTGGAVMYKAVNGLTWQPTSIVLDVTATLHPRGMTYLDDFTRPLLDESGKLQFVDVDAYQCSGVSTAQITDGKRGDVRYLKLPVGNPSLQHLCTFGPADDTNTYMMLRTSFPMYNCNGSAIQTNDTGATYGYNEPSGFSFSSRSGTLGEVNVNTANPISIWRFFLMPTNL